MVNIGYGDVVYGTCSRPAGLTLKTTMNATCARMVNWWRSKRNPSPTVAGKGGAAVLRVRKRACIFTWHCRRLCRCMDSLISKRVPRRNVIGHRKFRRILRYSEGHAQLCYRHVGPCSDREAFRGKKKREKERDREPLLARV